MKWFILPMLLSIVVFIPKSNAIFRNSSGVSALRSGRDRFREFIKWDVECNWLTYEERAIRASQGRCPPQTTTIQSVTYEESYFKRRKKAKKEKRLKKIKGIFSHSKKKKFIMVMSMGQQNLDELDAKLDHEHYRLLAGTMLQVTCNLENRTTNEVVSWFVNGRLIEPGLLDWRVSIGENGDLSVYPLWLDDGGDFECFVNNIYQGSLTIEVITRTEAIMDGISNYLIVAACFVLIALFALIIINGTASRPPVPDQRNDKMTQFLEEHVMKNGKEARENIAKIVYGRNLDKRRAVVEESLKSGRSQRGNKDTIMTILQPPQAAPTGVVVGSQKSSSLRRRRAVQPPRDQATPSPSNPFATPVFVDAPEASPVPAAPSPEPEAPPMEAPPIESVSKEPNPAAPASAEDRKAKPSRSKSTEKPKKPAYPSGSKDKGSKDAVAAKNKAKSKDSNEKTVEKKKMPSKQTSKEPKKSKETKEKQKKVAAKPKLKGK